MRSTTKSRLDMSREFHGLKPFTSNWLFRNGKIDMTFGPVFGRESLMFTGCAGDRLFGPKCDVEPEAEKISGCPVCGEFMLDVTAISSEAQELICANPECRKQVL